MQERQPNSLPDCHYPSVDPPKTPPTETCTPVGAVVFCFFTAHMEQVGLEERPPWTFPSVLDPMASHLSRAGISTTEDLCKAAAEGVLLARCVRAGTSMHCHQPYTGSRIAVFRLWVRTGRATLLACASEGQRRKQKTQTKSRRICLQPAESLPHLRSATVGVGLMASYPWMMTISLFMMYVRTPLSKSIFKCVACNPATYPTSELPLAHFVYCTRCVMWLLLGSPNNGC